MSQTIFGDAVPANNNNNDNSQYALATYFSVAVPGQVTHSRWRFPANVPSQQVKAALFQVSGGDTLLRLGAYSAPTPDAWNQTPWRTVGETPVDSPQAAVPGVTYATAIWTPDLYVSTSAYLAEGLTSGDLSVPPQGGRFREAPDLNQGVPTSQFNNGCYFVDVVFVPDGEAPAGPVFSIWTGVVEIPVTAGIWTGSAEVPIGSVDLA